METEKQRQYIAIDLKSFYASVECVERGLDPLKTNLVVADESRTEKTICLAVSPSLKAYGIPGRARLFEVVERVREVNAQKKRGEEPLTYIVAKPRMGMYMEYSTAIYKTYLKYVSPDDIQVYSVDEVFIDVTNYLRTYGMTARELATKMIHDVLEQTGITATCGIGTNLYLAKVAMDVGAKHVDADEFGVRICELDEMSYREKLWGHEPITDFWRVGKGYARKLNAKGMFTMGDVARCSVGKDTDFYNAELLYKMFGVNAELLIDHAWGWEPTTMKDVKAIKPKSKSLSEGQVLPRPYKYDEATIIIKEMAENVAMGLFKKGYVTKQLVVTVGYDISATENFKGELEADFYGRIVPKRAHGTINLDGLTNSADIIAEKAAELYARIVNPKLPVRRMWVVATNIERLDDPEIAETQISMFDLTGQEAEKSESEKLLQETIMNIKDKFGKNAILKARDFEEGATVRDRNGQVGGHKE